MTEVLVTGGAGFIGSNLVEALLERGDDVRVLDNFSTGSRANLAALGRDVEVVEGDLRSYERVHTAVRGVELVFHQGALGSVPRSVQDPLTSTAVNVEGTLNVLLAARDEGVRRVVFGVVVVGLRRRRRVPARRDAGAGPDLARTRSRSSRPSASASASRASTGSRRSRSGTSTSSGRARTRRSQYAAVVPRFISAIADGRPVTIHGDGEQSRDFTYVENVVRANLLAADAEGAAGRVLNVADGRIRDGQRARRHDRPPARQARREGVRAGAAGRRPRVVGRHRRGRARRSATTPRVGFEEGLERTIEAMRRNEGSDRVSHAFGSIEELGDGLRVPQGAAGARRRGVRRQRDRDAAGLRGVLPLPRRAGRAVLRARRDGPRRGRERGAAPRAGRARSTSPRRRRAASRTAATTTS